MNADSRRRRSKRIPDPSKIHSIKPGDFSTNELPCDVDAERFVLGAVFLDDRYFDEIAHLTPGDFSLERHRRILGSMRDLHDADESIDRITVANRLKERNEGSQDDLSFLVDLDTGIPRVPHLKSWCRILREKSILRRAIGESYMFIKECSLRATEPAEILAGHQARIDALNTEWLESDGIGRVEDLESVFVDRLPIEYIIEPELPVKTLVSLAGDSESGKTTLACAWARDALARGHAVLLLDRDKNPRERVRDRLERLGVQSDSKRLWVWDCEQEAEPPQPNDPRVVAWVKRMVAQTGKSPLVIGDSLVSFLMGHEDENSAKDMRAVFDRFRAINHAGGTGTLIHHLNRNGEARGSSDFKPAGDQGFLVSNNDRGGGRLLDVITLRFDKSRYGLSGKIVYHYAGGKMQRIEKSAGKSGCEQLRALLIAKPGVLTDQFVALAQTIGVVRGIAREFLKKGESEGTIRVEVHGRRRLHFCHTDAAETAHPGPSQTTRSPRSDQ